MRTAEQQRAIAADQHLNNIAATQEKHRQDLRLKAEAHKASVKAKNVQTAAAAKKSTGGK